MDASFFSLAGHIFEPLSVVSSLIAQTAPSTQNVNEVLTIADFTEALGRSGETATSITKGWVDQWSCFFSAIQVEEDQTCSTAFIYPLLNGVGIIAAVGTLIAVMFKIARDFQENNFSTAIPELLWPLVVTMLLSPAFMVEFPGSTSFEIPFLPSFFGGTTTFRVVDEIGPRISVPYNNLGSITLELQRLLRTVDNAVISIPFVASNQPVFRLQQQAQAMVSAPGVIQEFFGTCRSDQRGECHVRMIQQSMNLLDAYKAAYGEFIWLTDRRGELEALQQQIANRDDGTLPLSIYNDAVANGNLWWLVSDNTSNGRSQDTIPELAASLQLGFSQMLEAGWLFTALLGPIAVGSSLIPVPATNRAGLKWLAGFFAVGSTPIIYHVVTGITAAVMVGAEPSLKDVTWFSIFLGYVAPVLSLGLTTGGGFGLWNGLQSGVSPLLRQ